MFNLSKKNTVLVTLGVILAVNTFLIMTIWNKVLRLKIKGVRIGELSFFEALALSVFVSLLAGSSGLVSSLNTKFGYDKVIRRELR